jgi:hypothetical protein
MGMAMKNYGAAAANLTSSRHASCEIGSDRDDRDPPHVPGGPPSTWRSRACGLVVEAYRITRQAYLNAGT